MGLIYMLTLALHLVLFQSGFNFGRKNKSAGRPEWAPVSMAKPEAMRPRRRHNATDTCAVQCKTHDLSEFGVSRHRRSLARRDHLASQLVQRRCVHKITRDA